MGEGFFHSSSIFHLGGALRTRRYPIAGNGSGVADWLPWFSSEPNDNNDGENGDENDGVLYVASGTLLVDASDAIPDSHVLCQFPGRNNL